MMHSLSSVCTNLLMILKNLNLTFGLSRLSWQFVVTSVIELIDNGGIVPSPPGTYSTLKSIGHVEQVF